MSAGLELGVKRISRSKPGKNVAVLDWLSTVLQSSASFKGCVSHLAHGTDRTAEASVCYQQPLHPW